ncbi:type II secretion system protein N [Oleiagrimonas sp.]|jgi:general secretion pathway protein N|uniref:type II secretion system protein N n=1 Tax=Oleiagrimonas sp. TaxID=2010330 RepID=UPI002630C634|nr:type II secretion system protein N [Oleiagrimonas sp.]MDA3914678.1 type II secretion system protein N [Oleiagrimonas sp.]
MRRRWPWVLLVALLVMLALAVWFPAGWAWRMARGDYPQLQVGALHGSIWNGHASAVEYAGIPLGRLDWTLSRSALLGKDRLHLHVDGPLLTGSAQVQRDGSDRPVRVAMDAIVHLDQVPVSVGRPGLKPGGELHLRIPQMRLRGHWPQQLQGRIDWRAATLADRLGPVPLGTLHATLQEKAGTALEAVFSDAGGPLAVTGTAQATVLGWRLRAKLSPRSHDVRLEQVLEHLGRPDAQGSILLRQHGGVVMGDAP